MPSPGKPTLSIEYCTVCNFRGRAAWLAQEVLAAHEAGLAGVTLVPGRGGIFEVRLDGELLFSQKEAGRFPEPSEIKDALRTRLGLGPPARHSKATDN
jgi:selenoprotein W-related protein